MVNRNKTSTINQRLRDIKDVAPSSIYIEVTATPQAILLQTEKSQWKPSFIHYFKPGSNYIGGDFIYSEPTSFCIRFTEEDELDNIKSNSDFLPLGLRESLMTFLVICAEFRIKQKTNCNFLVHPSVRQSDHEKFATTLGENLNTFWEELNDGDTRNSFLKEVQSKWADLQVSYPDIAHYEDIYKSVEELLESESINIMTINANSSKEVSYEDGYNIVVGGNSLGRGVTLPKLQVVYYCRKSKVQQADTFWQHSRIFGYDREKGLIRVFLPPSLHKLFTDLNQSNKILIQQIVSNNTEGLQLIYPDNIKPTRKQVLDNKALNIITGGINFFALNPSESDPIEIDNLLNSYDEKKDYYEVNGEMFISVLEKVEKNNVDWNGMKYANCAKALLQRRPSQKFVIAVRRNREISKGTRTLLSETDNKLSKRLEEDAVLILYRLSGKTSNGWKGNPVWVPNIKFPDRMNFYDVIDL